MIELCNGYYQLDILNMDDKRLYFPKLLTTNGTFINTPLVATFNDGHCDLTDTVSNIVICSFRYCWCNDNGLIADVIINRHAPKEHEECIIIKYDGEHQYIIFYYENQYCMCIFEREKYWKICSELPYKEEK